MAAVNVLVDGFAYLGPLSYGVPGGLSVSPGDAVEVPFGKQQKTGLVIGPGSDSKATRDVIQRYGERTTDTDLETAKLVATEQASRLQMLHSRLAPKSGKGANPLSVSSELVTPIPEHLFTQESHSDRRQLLTLMNEPLVGSEKLAVSEARRLSETGQALILCPSVASVERVLSYIEDGAVRLDAKARRGDWAAFRAGTAPVGVGTRTAAWYSPKALEAIIVVDEHHPGHREHTAPRHHARDVAIARAKAYDAALVLISRNPSPVAMGCGTRVYQVGFTDQSPGWPEVVVHDETKDPVRTNDLPYTLEGEALALKDTNPPLVVVSGYKTQRCVSCFADMRPGKNCLDCGSKYSRTMGWDKERVHQLYGEEVQVALPHEVSTFKNAGLVIIPEYTSMLMRSELDPYRHASDVLLAASAAAGPAGKVVAVVRDPSHPVLKILLENKDQLGIARRRYKTAQRLNLPPFGKLATVQVLRKTLPDMTGWPGTLHGPAEIKGGWEFLVRCQKSDLPALRGKLDELRKRKVKLKYHID